MKMMTVRTEVSEAALEGRVIADVSLETIAEDSAGLTHVRDRYCPEMFSCFSFDCNGKQGKGCDRFGMLPGGVKFCKEKE